MRSFYRVRNQASGPTSVNNNTSSPHLQSFGNDYSQYNNASGGHNTDDDDIHGATYNPNGSQHRHNGSQSNTADENANSTLYLRVPMQAQAGWPLLASFLTFSGIISLLVAYLPFIGFFQAIVIFVDVRQLLTAFGCWYFAFCIWFLNKEVCG